MRSQFRIGNDNFSLESCRWKNVTFRERNQGTQFPINRAITSKMPTDRLHQCGAVLGDHLYLFGGVRKQRKQNSEIEANDKRFSAINLKNQRWHNLKTSSNPATRDSHKLTVMKQELFLFGGSDDKGYFNDLCAFNTFSNEWRVIDTKPEDSPSPRDPMIFTCAKDELLLLIGGICLTNEPNKRYLEDSFVFEKNEWSKYQLVNYPSGLICAQSVYVGNRVFAFGGIDRNTQQSNSILYEIIVDTSQKTVTFNQVQLTIQVSPVGRMNHSMLAINNQYFVLIGGSNANGDTLRDIWLFDLVANRWSLIQPSNGPLMWIHSHSAVLYNNKIYVLGGLNRENQFNTEVYVIEFANQEIFRSQVCQNCVSIMEKKQTQHKKYPKQMGISTGFLYNLALEVKFPFQAIMMLYNAATAFNPTYFRISVQKTLSSFNYIKIQWDGTQSFNLKSFKQFISHQFNHSQVQGTFKQIKQLTENIKLGALRLGKTFLLVTSSASHRYVYLLSAQSRVSPHFDQAYIYYCYVENLQLQRIETEEGIKQRQFILNFLRAHVPLDAELILQTKNKTLLVVFQPKVVMMAGKQYINELQSTEDDIKVWKNPKKVEFLQDRGYSIQEEVEISLRKWIMLYHLNNQLSKNISFYINKNESPVPHVSYIDFLRKLAVKGLVHRVPLPTDTGFNISGEIYITVHPQFIQSNYGLLIYLDSRLYSRYNTQFGRLFPQHFYKTKYKRARTIFNELGVINISTQQQNSGIYQTHDMESSKYYILMQKIQENCDEVRQGLENLTSQSQNQMNSQDKLTKKVKM